MKKYLLFSTIFLSLSSPALAGKEPVEKPKLTMEQAEKMLLEKVKGEILERKLDYEWGNPLYEFNIKTPESDLIEVEMDANTGEILETEKADDDD